MKKFLFSFFFLSMLAVGANAQKAACSKTCTKSASSAACQSKAPSAVSASNSADYYAAAAKLASMDETIISRADATTGDVAYYRKETCAHSGSVSYVNLNYDAATNTFVNVAPSTMEGAGVGKSSCSEKATSTSASGKPCCAAGVASGKTCCAGKAASVKTAEKVKS